MPKVEKNIQPDTHKFFRGPQAAKQPLTLLMPWADPYTVHISYVCIGARYFT